MLLINYALPRWKLRQKCQDNAGSIVAPFRAAAHGHLRNVLHADIVMVKCST